MMSPPRQPIVICADDYGISPSVNTAIRDLIARGRINATSVMVPAPGFAAAEVKSLRQVAAGKAQIGLHLTLTAPFQPLSRDYAPRRGGGFVSLPAMLGRAQLRLLKSDLLTEEIALQFQSFAAAFGRAPDFVDGHQHVHLFPQVSDALLPIVKKAAPQAWIRQCGRIGSARRRSGDRKALVLDLLSGRFRRLARNFGVTTNSAFAGAYTFRAGADYARLFAGFVAGMPAGGVIMCHPGIVDAQLRRLDPLTDLREREYAFFLADDYPKLLARHGVALNEPASA